MVYPRHPGALPRWLIYIYCNIHTLILATSASISLAMGFINKGGDKMAN